MWLNPVPVSDPTDCLWPQLGPFFGVSPEKWWGGSYIHTLANNLKLNYWVKNLLSCKFEEGLCWIKTFCLFSFFNAVQKTNQIMTLWGKDTDQQQKKKWKQSMKSHTQVRSLCSQVYFHSAAVGTLLKTPAFNRKRGSRRETGTNLSCVASPFIFIIAFSPTLAPFDSLLIRTYWQRRTFASQMWMRPICFHSLTRALVMWSTC